MEGRFYPPLYLETKGEKMSVQDNDLIQVQNLVDHSVFFTDDDTRRRFVFAEYEIKKIPAEVLRRLFYSNGGRVLLQNYLSVKNTELAREFGVQEDTIEYNWTRTDVNKMLRTGTMDELLDALDFGPEGIKDLIVSQAVAIELNDMQKRQAIFEKTGSNITHMIENKHTVEQQDATQEENHPSQRRASKSQTEDTQSTRRVKN